ncbi:hypothetical protein PR048_030866 [Dryococelus australis]|uniref:Tc1-like transposase DDE domain-containing protein n=1 Tax=Dryococelus australis TaxID=614101 RepID=A0ABQ9GCR5_9NEOP|nr:hypothetical protein PR048_030866 [Dryococelus australis]
MQQVPDVYLANLCNVISFHGIWKQKTHQIAPVDSTTPDTTFHLGSLFQADGQVRVWHKPNEAMEPIVKKAPCRLWWWFRNGVECVHWHGLGPLVHMPTKLNGNRNKTLLGDHLQPFIDFSFSDNDGMFQQHNAPSHRAANVQDWFEEHSGEFQRMEWPARSPDVNPIEHLWDVVERAIRTQDPALRNTRELWAAIRTAWLNISPEGLPSTCGKPSATFVRLCITGGLMTSLAGLSSMKCRHIGAVGTGKRSVPVLGSRPVEGDGLPHVITTIVVKALNCVPTSRRCSVLRLALEVPSPALSLFGGTSECPTGSTGVNVDMFSWFVGNPHQDQPEFNPRPGHYGFSHVGIVPDDVVGRWISRGPPVSPALALWRCSILTSITSSALKTSMLRAAQISSYFHLRGNHTYNCKTTAKTMVSSNTGTNRTGVLAVVDIGDSLLIGLKCQQMCADLNGRGKFDVKSWGSAVAARGQRRCPLDDWDVQQQAAACPRATRPSSVTLVAGPASLLLHFLLLGGRVCRGRAPKRAAASECGRPYKVRPRVCRGRPHLSSLGDNCWRGHGGVVVRLPASHLGEAGSIPGGVTPGFSLVGIAPDCASGRLVFSAISRRPP